MGEKVEVSEVSKETCERAEKQVQQYMNKFPHLNQIESELQPLVHGFKVNILQGNSPRAQRFNIDYPASINFRDKSINIVLWQSAKKEDALAILAHEYGHAQAKKGYMGTEIFAWKKGKEFAKNWGVLPQYQALAKAVTKYEGTDPAGCRAIEVAVSDVPETELLKWRVVNGKWVKV